MAQAKTSAAQVVPFRLAKIQTMQFAIIESSFSSDMDVEISQQFNFSIDTDTQQVAVAPHYTFFQKNPFVIIEVQCIFSIPGPFWKKWMNVQEGVFTLPKNVATHMAVLSVGTTRGVLHAKTEGTLFNMYVLPTWNLAEIIKDDWVVQVQIAQ